MCGNEVLTVVDPTPIKKIILQGTIYSIPELDQHNFFSLTNPGTFCIVTTYQMYTTSAATTVFNSANIFFDTSVAQLYKTYQIQVLTASVYSAKFFLQAKS